MFRKMNKNIEIIDGKVVSKKAVNQKVIERQKSNNKKVIKALQEGKKVSKEQVLALGEICVNDILPGDKTPFMCHNFSSKKGETGIITIAFENIVTLTKDAWVKEDGTINFDLFYKAFICCDKKYHGGKEDYDQIWRRTKSYIENIGLEFCPEVVFNISYISNVEIAAFIEQMKALDPSKITYDTIVMIQEDLTHIFRGMQESSVDVSKDKEKSYKYRWDEIIGFVHRIFSTDSNDYKDNLDEIIKRPDIEYSVSYDVPDGAKETRNDIICKALVDVHEEFINKEVLATAKESITDILCSVVGTSDILTDNEKLHMESLINVINASFKVEERMEATEVKAIRDAMYTIASQNVETADEATAMILDCIIAKYHTYKGKVTRNTDASKFRMGCAKVILGGILPLFLCNRNTYTKMIEGKDFILYEEIESDVKLTVKEGDIILDEEIVGNIDIDANESYYEIESDACFIIDGDLYIEVDAYQDLDCNVHTLCIDTLYNPCAPSELNNNIDQFGRDTINAFIIGNNARISGKNHNALILDGYVRGRLNTYSAEQMADVDEMIEITGENTICINVEYNEEEDKYAWLAEAIIFYAE